MKEAVTDLAILGGPKAFPNPLHVGRPNIGDEARYLALIKDMLSRRWLTNSGPYVQELEARIARHLGVRHVVLVCNATIALELAARALGFSGEVIVPAFTFVATAHCLLWQQITPVFCDIDPTRHSMDPGQIEKMITPRTTGILPVHLWGNACDIEAIQAIAAKRGLKVLYDASHAFGCTYRGQMIGAFGNAEVFSFHATKFLNTLEGGAVSTNDDELAERLRLMRNFGFAGLDKVVYIGTNGKMTEASAAMGLVNLDHVDRFIELNRSHYERYRDRLSQIPGLSLYVFAEQERSNYQYVVVTVDAVKSHLTRDRLVAILTAENVLARRYFYPGVHRMEPYRSYFPNAGALLPNTSSLCDKVMALPTGTGVTGADIDGVCALLRFAVEHAAAIEAKLPSAA